MLQPDRMHRRSVQWIAYILIHGHTHRMAMHEFKLSDKTAHRIVLGDWYKKGNYLVHDQHGFRLLSYPDDTVLATLAIQ